MPEIPLSHLNMNFSEELLERCPVMSSKHQQQQVIIEQEDIPLHPNPIMPIPVHVPEPEMDYTKFFKEAIDTVKLEGRYRVFKNMTRERGNFPHAEGTDVIVWCSNDYLGMGQHPKVVEAITKAVEENGAGSGGTRNIAGTNKFHLELEAELADLHHKEASLLFANCYSANQSAISTIVKLIPGLILFFR
jgi:hypothetical protein